MNRGEIENFIERTILRYPGNTNVVVTRIANMWEKEKLDAYELGREMYDDLGSTAQPFEA